MSLSHVSHSLRRAPRVSQSLGRGSDMSRLTRRAHHPHQRLSSRASSTTTSTVDNSTTATSSTPVAKSLVAAFLGVATVSLTAALVEVSSADDCPAYHPNQQRFSQSHFSGRFSRMLLACDPRLLVYSDEEIRRAKSMLDDYQETNDNNNNNNNNNNNKDISPRVLWEARRMVDAAMHPDTGDILPRPFRMSGYVPYNGPICVAMIASTSTLPLLFWSWVNQSQNALVNYYNRNASSAMTNETMAKSYGVAVGSALTVAFGLATAIQKRFEPSQAKLLLRWVAFPSAVVASSLNCFIVRRPEIESGIPLLDASGNDVLPGTTSNIAAAKGVYSTTASRAILQAPVFFLPPALVSIGPFKRYIAKHPSMAVPISTYMILVCFGLGLPATTAIFPQIAEIPATDVEDRFQHLRNVQHEPYTVFYYNKGL